MTIELPEPKGGWHTVEPLALKSNEGLGAWVPITERLPEPGYRDPAGQPPLGHAIVPGGEIEIIAQEITP